MASKPPKVAELTTGALIDAYREEGFLYSAQCKWRNGENNRTLTVTLFITLNLTINDYFRHCAICIAPNTDSPRRAVPMAHYWLTQIYPQSEFSFHSYSI